MLVVNIGRDPQAVLARLIRLRSRCHIGERLGMLKTALDDIAMPPSAKLLGWWLLDARPWEGWLKVSFDGRAEFCNPAGFIAFMEGKLMAHHGTVLATASSTARVIDASRALR